MKRIIVVVLLIIIAFSLSALQQTISAEYRLDSYKLSEKSGITSLNVANMGMVTSPNQYSLPYKAVFIVLPADAEVVSYSMQAPSSIVSIKAPLQKNTAYSNGAELLNSQSRVQISHHLRYLGTGKWGKVTFAKFGYLPFLVNSDKGLDYAPSISIQVTINQKSEERPILTMSSIDQMKSYFLNTADLTRYYQKETRSIPHYLVLTNNALWQAAQPLVAFHRSQNMEVQYASIDSIISNYPGTSQADKVRAYLIEKDNSWDITYLLLIGDRELLPVASLTPEPNGTDTVPSDYYYVDLSSNWDSDQDGRLGEYSTGIDEDAGMDFTPELFVGRIPFNSASAVAPICQRIVTYETTQADWKKNVLLPAAMLNYNQEDNNPGWEKTDGATLCEYMKAHIWDNSYQITSLYETYGLTPTVYTPDYPLTEENFTNLLNTNNYGYVNWNAHGSATSSARKVWTIDFNGDNIAQDYENEWFGLVSTDLISSLTNTTPALFYCSSCLNGTIDGNEPSLGMVLVRDKAVGAIAATRTGWYKIGWENPSWGGISSYNYYFNENYFTHHQSAGMAHEMLNLLYSSYFLFGDPDDTGGIVWPELQNIYTYLYYGDPAVNYQAVSDSLTGEVMVYDITSDTTNQNLINSLYRVTKQNVIYTHSIAPNFLNLNEFESVWIIGNADISNTTITTGSDEEAALLAYLNAGGRVYLEDRSVLSNPNFSTSLRNYLGLQQNNTNTETINNLVSPYSTLEWSYIDTNYNADTFVCTERVTPFLQNTGTNPLVFAVLSQPQASNAKAIVSSIPLRAVGPTSIYADSLVALINHTFVTTTTNGTNDPSLATQSLCNYPNPFNPETKIRFSLTKPCNANLAIYNLKGQKVKSLIHANLPAGTHEFNWNGKDEDNHSVASGIYYYRLSTPTKTIVNKMLLLK